MYHWQISSFDNETVASFLSSFRITKRSIPARVEEKRKYHYYYSVL